MQIMANFTSSMVQYLDARQKWASLAELQANSDILMPNGFIAYCEAENDWYKLTATDVRDPATYSWAKFVSSVELTNDTAIAKLGASSFAEAIAALAADDYAVIEKAATPEDTFATTYKLKVKDATAPEGYKYIGDPINIPKDMVVQSATLETCAEDNVPVAGFVTGDRYIDLLIANSDGTHLYINVKDLVNDDASKITYAYLTNPEVPESKVTVQLNAMLDTLRLATANLTPEGRISSDYVDYDETDTVTTAIDKLKSGLAAAQATIKNLVSGETVKPEFVVTPSNKNFLNVTSTQLDNLTFGVAASSISLVEGDITVELYKGGDVIDTKTITQETTTVTLTGGTVTTDTTFKVVCSYKFEGDVDSRTEEVSVSYKYVDYTYFGILEPTANFVDSIDSLSTVVKTSAGYTYNGISLKNKKICYAFPASLGTVTNIKDGNNFDVTDAFDKTTPVDVNGVNYTVFVSKETMTLTNGKLIFS